MEIRLNDLIKQLQDLEREIMGSHHVKESPVVNFIIANEEAELDYDIEIKEIEPRMAIGCGCWTGVNIWVELKPWE